jgi:hypothetical protein
MKKIILLVMGISCSLISMEPLGGHKDKVRSDTSSNVSSGGNRSSGSAASSLPLEVIDLQDNKKNTSGAGHGSIIVVHTQEDLERILQQQGVQIQTSQGKHRSIVLMPRMDMDALNTDLGHPNDQDFKEVFNFFKETLKQHHDIDISKIERRLTEKLKEIHDSPPNSPVLGKDVNKLQKAQSAVQILRRASIHQSTIRTERPQLAKKSPVFQKARDPKPLEIIQEIAQDPNVQDNLNILKDLAFKLLNEKLDDTQDSKTKTTWVGAAATVGGAIASALITYLSTKKSC